MKDKNEATSMAATRRKEMQKKALDDAKVKKEAGGLKLGDRVRSFDFDAKDLEGDRANYVEGIIYEITDHKTHEFFCDCDRYKVRVYRRVWQGERLWAPQEPKESSSGTFQGNLSTDSEAEYVYPPVNGTPTWKGGKTDKVQLIGKASSALMLEKTLKKARDAAREAVELLQGAAWKYAYEHASEACKMGRQVDRVHAETRSDSIVAVLGKADKLLESINGAWLDSRHDVDGRPIF